jgi:hypothetical protein
MVISLNAGERGVREVNNLVHGARRDLPKNLAA